MWRRTILFERNPVSCDFLTKGNTCNSSLHLCIIFACDFFFLTNEQHISTSLHNLCSMPCPLSHTHTHTHTLWQIDAEKSFWINAHVHAQIAHTTGYNYFTPFWETFQRGAFFLVQTIDWSRQRLLRPVDDQHRDNTGIVLDHFVYCCLATWIIVLRASRLFVYQWNIFTSQECTGGGGGDSVSGRIRLHPGFFIAGAG